MCGRKDDLETEVEDGGKCSKPSKTLLFVFNIIIWLGSCALLALGIFGLVDSPFTQHVMDGNIMLMGAVVLISVGAVGFIISFLGCCGALTNSKCLIMTYIVVLIIMLAVLLIGGILGFLFSSRLNDAAVETMRKTLEKYDTRDVNAPVAQSWDGMQRTLKCCGVMNYRNWETYNANFRGSQKIPESCCVLDQATGRPRTGCTAGTRTNDFYSGNDDGCHRKLVQLIEQNTPIVAIVTAIVAICMLLGIGLGILVYKRL